MTEFLTENARRAYPLEYQWPSSVDSRWTRALLDASIGYSGILGDEERVKLISVKCTTSGTRKAVLTIGVSATNYVDIDVETGLANGATVYGSSTSYKAFITVNGSVIDELVTAATSDTAISVGIPFALRCVSSSKKMVTAVEAYANVDEDGNPVCSTPVFCESVRTAVRTVTGGSVILGSKDGIDIETTTMAPIDGEILRISAIAAPAETAVADPDIDLMIRGDDCITVEAIPGAYVASGGAVVPFDTAGSGYTSADKCGVIKIGTKCKPCCQCEDYRDAAESLRPAETAATSVKSILDAAKAIYDSAVETFNTAKQTATETIASYDNIHASATSALSGGVCTEANASGTRSRIAITLLVSNMTLEVATISNLSFTVPGFDQVKLQWATAGSSPNPRSGTSVGAGQSWTLNSGDSLTVVATYSQTATTNTASKPSGMTAAFTASLPARTDIPTRAASSTKTVTVT